MLWFCQDFFTRRSSIRRDMLALGLKSYYDALICWIELLETMNLLWS